MQKAIIDGLISLLAPAVCLGCQEGCHNGLFCSICRESVELLDPTLRCYRCFSVNETSSVSITCNTCRKYPYIYRRGVVFERSDVLDDLLKEGKKQKDLIAALFTWQFIRLKWPLFDYITSESSLKNCTKVVAQNFQRQKNTKKRLGPGVNVLYLSTGLDEVKFPFSVSCGKIYHLSFFLPIY